MAALNPPYALQNRGDHTAQGDRLLVNSLVTNSGVVGINDLKVTAMASPSMRVQIASGRAFISGTLNALQGTYHCVNDAVLNVPLNPASATMPRKDIIVARVNDAFYSGSTNDWSLTAIAGTPAGTPVLPVTPPNAIVLAEITIAANATQVTNANIVDRRGLSSSNLTNLMSSSVAASMPTVGVLGQQWYTTDNDQIMHWNGSAWVGNTIAGGPGGAVGFYQKSPDGTLICSMQTSRNDIAIGNYYGGGLYQGTWMWTYPHAFIYNPAVLCSAFRWGSSASWATIGTTITTTAAELRGIDIQARNAGTNVLLTALAVGRWK